MDAMVAFAYTNDAFPTTPTPTRITTSGLGGRNTNSYRPMLSSPLAPSAGHDRSSPIVEAQARRRTQYKSRSTSNTNRRIVSDPATRAMQVPVPFSLTVPGQSRAESSRAAFLRDRIQAKVMREHERRVERRRTASSDLSSDGFDAAMEDDSDDADGEDGLNEEERYFSDEVRLCCRTLFLHVIN